MLPMVDLLLTSIQEQVYRIAVLHEGTSLGIPAEPIYDTHQTEKCVERREVRRANASQSTLHIGSRNCDRRHKTQVDNRSSTSGSQ